MRRSTASSLLFLSLVAAGCGAKPYSAQEVKASFAQEGEYLREYGPFESLLGEFSARQTTPAPQAALAGRETMMYGPALIAVVYRSEADAIQAETEYGLRGEYASTLAKRSFPAALLATTRKRNVVVLYWSTETPVPRYVQIALNQLRCVPYCANSTVHLK